MWIILLFLLAVYSYRDIREKKIPVPWLIMGLAAAAVLGLCSRIRKEDMDLWRGTSDCLLGTLPGILFTLLSFILKGKVGAGDGMVLTVIGALTDIKYGVAILAVSLLMSFVYSGILLVASKKGKDYCFPFIPFYLLGTIVVYMGKG